MAGGGEGDGGRLENEGDGGVVWRGGGGEKGMGVGWKMRERGVWFGGGGG